MEYHSIEYRFYLPGGHDLSFKLRLDPHSLEAVEPSPNAVPDWAALDCNKCPNCPLDSGKHPHCPAALKLVKLIDKCRGLNAYAQVRIEVITPERTVIATRPLQKGLSSLAGLIMATSGCPNTAPLKPMARFHLPFAVDDETLYRATSMYLLGQYFVHKQGQSPDLELDGLVEIYRLLQAVNASMTKRLGTVTSRDIATDAILSLDLFSHILPYDVKASLSKIRDLFEPFLSR